MRATVARQRAAATAAMGVSLRGGRQIRQWFPGVLAFTCLILTAESVLIVNIVVESSLSTTTLRYL